MAIGVKAGEDILSLGQRSEVVLVLQEALGQLSIAGIAATQPGDVEVFRKSVGFVPAVGDILVRQCTSL